MACVEIEFRTIFDCIPVCLVLLLLPMSDCCRFFASWSFVCVFMCAYAMRVIGFFVICLFAMCVELSWPLVFFVRLPATTALSHTDDIATIDDTIKF